MFRRGRLKDAGYSLFELVVVVTLIAILAAVLLNYVLEYSERAEKAAMEQVASAIRAGLQFRVAGLIVRNADAEIPKLADQNPMDWLSEKPHIYAGEFNGVPPLDLVLPRSWYYDSRDKRLVYRVQRARHLDSPGNPENDVRFKVWVEEGALPDAEMLAEPLRGIRRAEFAPVTPYRWFIPEQ